MRLAYLDGIRGIAILLVLWYHYVTSASDNKWLRYCTELSITGVDLFFVLSGFLITGILRKNRGASNYFAVFYVRRAARILPLYLLLLTAFVVLPKTNGWLFDGSIPFWNYLTFTQNIAMGAAGSSGAHFLGITWSLALEEQFYLLMPLLIYALNWRWVVLACIAGSVLCICLRFGFPGFHAYVNLPFRLDALLYGSLIALVNEARPEMILGNSGKWCLAVVTGVAFCVAASLGLVRISSETRHTVIAFFYAAGILWAISSTRVQSILSNPALVWFGVCAYGIYISHEAVSGYVHGGEPVFGWRTLAAAAITLAVSGAAYRWIEQPINSLGKRCAYHGLVRRAEVIHRQPASAPDARLTSG